MSLQSFWDNKILDWEKSRYTFPASLHPFSWSIKSRFHAAISAIQEISQEKAETHILDLGCGSGKLLEHIDSLKGLYYSGYDFSLKAITNAQQKTFRSHAIFCCDHLEKIPSYPKATIAVLLGISDWLLPENLELVLSRITAENMLISYTSRRNSLKNFLYKNYRLVQDKNKIMALSYVDEKFAHIYTNAGWMIHKDLSSLAMAPGKLLWLKKVISI